MARLTGTQKKKRNQFVALLVAILVVAAAIFYVLFSAYMSKSGYMANQDFATALADALGKSARSVSTDDLAKVKYVEVYNDGTNASVYLGYEDFMEQYDKYMAEVDAAAAAEEAGEEVPEITTEHPVSLAKYGFFEGANELTVDDIKYFTGAEVLSLSNFDFDTSDLGTFANLKSASFTYCGLDNEDLASLAKSINLEQVEDLTFMGNSIDDWSPVESISDKVTIASYGYTVDEEGQLQMTSNEQTLTEYLAAKAEAEAKAAEEAAKAEAGEAEVEPEAEPEAEENEEVTE